MSVRGEPRELSFAFFRHRHRVAAAGLVFVTGVALILGAELSSSHHVISTALGDAGGLLAGSVALAVLYDIVVKPAQTEETFALAQTAIWEPLRALLSAEHAETAALVDGLTEPVTALRANQELLFSQRVKLEIPGAGTAGFLGVIPRLDFEQIFEGLGVGDELLWLDTYCPVQRAAEDALFEAVRAGAHVRMLAIDPEAPNCAARAEEIKETAFSTKIFHDEAETGLQHLRDYAAEQRTPPLHGSLEVRLYRGLPCVPMYLRVRDGEPHVGYTSFFLTRATFREPHVVWGPQSPAGFLERFEEYFRHRWTLAEATPFLTWGPDGG